MDRDETDILPSPLWEITFPLHSNRKLRSNYLRLSIQRYARSSPFGIEIPGQVHEGVDIFWKEDLVSVLEAVSQPECQEGDQMAAVNRSTHPFREEIQQLIQRSRFILCQGNAHTLARERFPGPSRSFALDGFCFFTKLKLQQSQPGISRFFMAHHHTSLKEQDKENGLSWVDQ
jgi:hypothetical protein